MLQSFHLLLKENLKTFKNGDIVFYASESENINAANEQNMEEIFIYALDDENPIIVLASKATKYVDNSK